MHLNQLNTPLLLFLHILLATLLLQNSNNNNKFNTGTVVATAQQTTVNSGVANLMQVNFEQTLAAKLAEEEKTFSSSSSSASGAAPATSTSLLLSRKRRYLLFPEGSSFQLVYDGIFGIVDYVNYLILGITCALAWELPSKAPSEMIEDIRIQLQEGTLGQPVASSPSRRNDTINNITYVDTTKLKTSPSSTGKKTTYLNLSQNPINPLVSRNNYYTKNSYLMPASHAPMHQNYYRPYSYPNNKYSGLSEQWNRNRGKNGVINGGGHYYYPAGKKNWQRKDDYYYSKNVNPFSKWTKVKTDGYGYTPAGSKYPWWNLASRLSNSLRGIPRPVATSNRKVDRNNTNNNGNRKPPAAAATAKNPKQQQQKIGNYQSNTAARNHRIYPVFGKRSISDQQHKNINLAAVATNASTSPTVAAQSENENMSHHRQRRSGVDSHELSKLDRLHIRHHRQTRQTLYEKIEKYLDKRGLHGQHCVLRTLCETGQKSHENFPGSFVGELMRTLFTLPEVIEEYERRLHDERKFEQPEVLHHRQRRYDEANVFAGDCAERYKLCKDSLWASEFVM